MSVFGAQFGDDEDFKVSMLAAMSRLPHEPVRFSQLFRYVVPVDGKKTKTETRWVGGWLHYNSDNNYTGVYDDGDRLPVDDTAFKPASWRWIAAEPLSGHAS